MIVQYGIFLSGLLQGDFGLSYRMSEPVMDVIASRLPATVELSFVAAVMADSGSLVCAAMRIKPPLLGLDGRDETRTNCTSEIKAPSMTPRSKPKVSTPAKAAVATANSERSSSHSAFNAERLSKPAIATKTTAASTG